MNYRPLLALVCVLGSSTLLFAQNKEASKPAEAKTLAAGTTTDKDAEAERILRERRANAQSMLLSLAADAGRYTDQTLRARTQARIADVLWDADPDRARSLFRKAWESAEIVDQEGQRKLQEDIKQQQQKNAGSVAVTGPPNIRGEVLRLAARRDRALGEELLAKLRVEKEREATELADKTRSNSFDAPEAVAQRLSLARQLLNSDDVERAMQFAAPALQNITRDSIDFLSYLREKDSAAADSRYAALLARAGESLASDANTVSLLSSYIFTPHTFVTFQGGGANTQSSRAQGPPPDVPVQLRNAFFFSAADILMRPLAPGAQDQTTAGPIGKYLMIKRLLPLFEQYAPKELIDPLRGQLDALAQGVPDEARQRDDDTLREGIRPPQSGEDREKALRDRIDRAKTSEERDGLYIQLARLYVESGDLKARDFIDKVEDTELRKQARAFVDATLVNWAIDKKDPDRTLELVRTGELTHLQKSWAMLQAAKVLVKTDRDKALTVIEDATAEARRLETSDPDRPRALMAVANLLLLADRPKTWDAVYEAIKAANSSEGFTGEDGVIRTTLRTKSMSSVRSSSVADFNVNGVFTELAKEDYERTVELVRGFEKEAPRASATIAIARTVLEDKKR